MALERSSVRMLVFDGGVAFVKLGEDYSMPFAASMNLASPWTAGATCWGHGPLPGTANINMPGQLSNLSLDPIPLLQRYLIMGALSATTELL